MTSFEATPPMADADWHRCEAVLEAFETAWQKEAAPRLESFLLPIGDPARHHLLVELIKIDLEYRWTSGECPSIDHYLGRFPELVDSDQARRELIQTESRLEQSYGVKLNDAKPTPKFTNVQSGFSGRRAIGFVADTAVAPENPAQVAVGAPSVGSSHRLGRYELREVLGRGGFATVYRAWDPELCRDVAIKLFQPELAEQRELMARVSREAQSAAQLRHPAIVPVHEVGQQGSSTYIVYDFIPGGTLAERMQRTNSSHRHVAEWIARIAEALDYAHQCGIVHRDVKPANILMRVQREGGRASSASAIQAAPAGVAPTPEPSPMLIDFGLALHEDGGATLTQEGDLLGTPAYMSPEQARGSGHAVDARSDVYALGVVLYELLCGRPPFGGDAQAYCIKSSMKNHASHA